MVIVSVLARKGGTGKSTAVRCLAIEALRPVGAWSSLMSTAANLLSLGPAPDRCGHPRPTCGNAGRRHRRPSRGLPAPAGGLIIIDTPPTATPAVNAALDISSAAVVVTRPNPEDLESVQRITSSSERPASQDWGYFMAGAAGQARSSRRVGSRGLGGNGRVGVSDRHFGVGFVSICVCRGTDAAGTRAGGPGAR